MAGQVRNCMNCALILRILNEKDAYLKEKYRTNLPELNEKRLHSEIVELALQGMGRQSRQTCRRVAQRGNGQTEEIYASWRRKKLIL